MAKTKKAGNKFKLPPKPETETPKLKKVDEFIKQGGSPTSAAGTIADGAPAPDQFKSFNIKILESKLNAIHAHRETYPKPAGRKSPSISTLNWIIEAIEEKLQRPYVGVQEGA